MSHPRWSTLPLSVALLAGCADTNAPLPEPQEVLLAVNRTANTLSIVPVDDPSSAASVPLGGTGSTPTGVSARGAMAIVPLGLADAVAVVDLRTRAVVRRVALPDSSGATGSAVIDDSIAYVANPNLNSVSRVNYLEGTTAELVVGRHPRGLIFTRGRLFVLSGKLDDTLVTIGPGWLSVVDPASNKLASGRDSIPLTGPGNAGFATVAVNGLMYVMSTGSSNQDEGRLSIVDPVARVETASFSGFGANPGSVAADADSKVYASSYVEGLLVFDTDSNKVVRGAGDGVPIPSNSAVAVDSRNRIYAIEAGPCRAGRPGKAHVLGPDLAELRTITLGDCPSGAAVVQIPPE
ncbi:MAG TPA: hypothetical protein VHR41_14955 [Gemmatimonadales bacterium]|nr:hypothetical protein [Gemmatimonadales bacterium]